MLNGDMCVPQDSGNQTLVQTHENFVSEEERH